MSLDMNQEMNGQGIENNGAGQIKQYMKEAEAGNPGAQYKLGACYAAGVGVKQNFIEAMR
jgi:TPR repeat protein